MSTSPSPLVVLLEALERPGEEQAELSEEVVGEWEDEEDFILCTRASRRSTEARSLYAGVSEGLSLWVRGTRCE